MKPCSTDVRVKRLLLLKKQSRGLMKGSTESADTDRDDLCLSSTSIIFSQIRFRFAVT